MNTTNWFVENVQNGNDDCNAYEVSLKKIQELVTICKKIKRGSTLIPGKIKNGQTAKGGKWEDIIEDGKFIVNPELAKKLLPTQSGFFFGSTEYDQWYMEDIEDTIRMLEPLCTQENDHSVEYRYQSSW